MDKRRSVNTQFWSDSFIEDLQTEEKLLFLYLLTNEKTNMLGIYEISVKRMSYETGLTAETIRNAFKAFESVRKVFYIDGWVCLANWIKNQSMNANMLKSAKNEFKELPKLLIDKMVSVDLKPFENLPNHSRTLPNPSEPFANPSEGLQQKSEAKETLSNGCRILSNYEKENENENEKEKEKENEKGNFQIEVLQFLKTEKIENSVALEFLESEMYFDQKAMQLQTTPEAIFEKAKEFLICARDSDQIEGKYLAALRSWFVNWYKLKAAKEKTVQAETWTPDPNRL